LIEGNMNIPLKPEERQEIEERIKKLEKELELD